MVSFRLSRRAMLVSGIAATAPVMAGVVTPARAAGRVPPPPGGYVPSEVRLTAPLRQIPLPAGYNRGHAAFPGMVLRPDRTLTIAYRNAAAHLSLDGVVVVADSTDAGLTYGNYRVAAEASASHGTPAGDLRDPSLAYIGGELWVTYCVGPTAVDALGAYVKRGTRPAVRIDPGLPEASMCSPVVPLPDGSLGTAFYGKATGETRASCWFARSTNGGASWTSIRIVDGQALGNDFPEPWLLVRGTKLIIMHRHGGWSNVGVTSSTDNGATWTPTRVAIVAATGRPTTLAMSTGRLLMVYRHPDARSALMAVSYDDGLTWKSAGTLLPSEGGPLGMTYAAMAEVLPGVVHVVVASERPNGSSVLHAGYLAG